MQLINTGHTRLVVLAGPYAFKIAKFRLLYALWRIVVTLWNREAVSKMSLWRRKRGGVMSVVLQAVFAGVYANLAEHGRYQEYPGAGLVPTLTTWWGIVNVQKRGDTLRAIAIDGHPLFQQTHLDPSLSQDLLRPEQYCMLHDQVLLADYGNPALEPVFRAWISG